jgi:drug/metabolite transporter (DMT)-like permease
MSRPRTILWTSLALTGFAANSLLCRAALRPRSIDAASFTSVRLVSGALVLGALVAARSGPRALAREGSWRGALALFAYAIAFSFAYLRLGAGVGSLVLFGVVQATMIAAGWRAAERLRPRQWLGLALALGGLAALTAPGATAPDPLGAASMALAGAAWGCYSLIGRGCARPLQATAGNFVRGAPLALAASALALRGLHLSAEGFALAVASGALASGVGYALWYAALRELTATTAAIVQLCVPVLATLASVALLGETLTLRIALAGATILAGVAVAVLRPRLPQRSLTISSHERT